MQKLFLNAAMYGYAWTYAIGAYFWRRRYWGLAIIGAQVAISLRHLVSP